MVGDGEVEFAKSRTSFLRMLFAWRSNTRYRHLHKCAKGVLTANRRKNYLFRPIPAKGPTKRLIQRGCDVDTPKWKGLVYYYTSYRRGLVAISRISISIQCRLQDKAMLQAWPFVKEQVLPRLGGSIHTHSLQKWRFVVRIPIDVESPAWCLFFKGEGGGRCHRRDDLQGECTAPCTIFKTCTYHLWQQVLRTRGVKNLVLTGVTTDVCVHTTMRNANDMGYECVLLEVRG